MDAFSYAFAENTTQMQECNFFLHSFEKCYKIFEEKKHGTF